MAKTTTIFELLDPLGVFVEYDTEYDIYVAQCLQTGHMVSASDQATVESMIIEVLGDEVSYAIERDDLQNLVSAPAPMEVWAKWKLAAATNNTHEAKIRVHGELPQQLRMLIGQAEVETAIRIAIGQTAAAA